MHPDAVVEVPLWLLARRDLTPQAKTVWAALSYLLPRFGPAISQREIGRLCGCTDRPPIYGATVDLEAAGLLHVLRANVRATGRLRRNHYTLIDPREISTGPEILLDSGDATCNTPYTPRDRR